MPVANIVAIVHESINFDIVSLTSGKFAVLDKATRDRKSTHKRFDLAMSRVVSYEDEFFNNRKQELRDHLAQFL